MNRMWVRGRDQKGASRRNNTIACKRKEMPRTVIILIPRFDEAKDENCVRSQGGWALSLKPSPSDDEMRDHTYLHHTDV